MFKIAERARNQINVTLRNSAEVKSFFLFSNDDVRQNTFLLCVSKKGCIATVVPFKDTLGSAWIWSTGCHDCVPCLFALSKHVETYKLLPQCWAVCVDNHAAVGCQIMMHLTPNSEGLFILGLYEQA